jgi:regulator of protease activity HflC (stomatin/prohibitin superfamily)
MDLDHVYEEKATVARNVQVSLSDSMNEFGYLIIQALVTDIVPDINVRNAMNEINAAKRMRYAMQEKAEGDKIMLVKAAEADAESKYLSGVGIARQRAAIVGGLRDSVMEFSDNVPGSGPKDVINLLMITQYFDMLKDVGNNATTSSVFIPNDGGTQTGAVRNGLLQGQAARLR